MDYLISALFFAAQFTLIGFLIYSAWRDHNHPDPREREFHRKIEQPSSGIWD